MQLPLSDGFQESPFASYEINHLISVMAMILMPIQKREEFLEKVKIRMICTSSVACFVFRFFSHETTRLILHGLLSILMGKRMKNHRELL